MRRIVSLITVVSLLVNCTHFMKPKREEVVTGPIVISTRIGDVLDTQEREYYGLFPKIYVHPATYPFESAEFFRLEGGGYEVRIATGYNVIIAQNRGSYAIDILRNYIDNYEDIAERREAFEKRWNVVAYDDLGQPITKGDVDDAKSLASAMSCALPAGLLLGVGLGVLVMAGVIAFFTNLTSPSSDSDGFAVPGAVTLLLGGGCIVGCIGGLAQMSAPLDRVKKAREPKILE